MNRHGYTLMEILAIISILAAAASVAGTSISSFFSSQQATAMATELAGDIRMARSTAISQGSYTRIAFNADRSAWVVQELRDAGNNLIVGIPTLMPSGSMLNDFAIEPTNWRTIIDGESREVPPEVTVTSTPSTTPTIFFNPDGTIREAISPAAPPLGVVSIHFNYGPATCSVDIMPFGVVESVFSYEEEY